MHLTLRHLVVSAVAAGVVGVLGALVDLGDSQPGLAWKAPVLGGEIRVSLYVTDTGVAVSSLSAVAANIRQLEDIFSVRREGFEVSRLNRESRLTAPSRDLLDLISLGPVLS